MVGRIDDLGIAIADLPSDKATSARYDIGVWSAGYEERAGWLVQSRFKPSDVGQWYRVEFLDNRDKFSAPRNLSLSVGLLLGDAPATSHWDGHWILVWRKLLRSVAESAGEKLRLFVDYSSMPRTVYGTLLHTALNESRQFVREITLAYVPGVWGSSKEGSTELKGLRAIIGTEGRSQHERDVAFVVGLGYDGVLAQAILDFYQVTHFSSFYADPGVTPTSVDRAKKSNEYVLDNSELIATAPAWSVSESLKVALRLSDWYMSRRDVILVVLGPKPHAVGGLLASALCGNLAYRMCRTGEVTPVQVGVPAGAEPYFTRITVS